MSVSGPRGASGSGPGDTMEALRRGRIEGADARLSAASSMLEGVFYQELFKAMRATVPTEGGVIPNGGGQEMFESLLDERIAEAAALSSERGLGSALYRYLSGVAGTDASGASGGEASE